jgi:hypothetical protein
LAKLGIEVFPLKGIIDAFKVAHNSATDFIAENIMPKDGLEILSRMLHDLAPHTIVTQGDTRRVSGRSDIGEHALNDRIPDVVYARHIVTTGRTYLSVHAAKEWCRKHNLPEGEVVTRARDERVFELFERERKLSSKKFDLYKGMQQSTGTFVHVYSIDKRLLAQKLGQQMDDIVPAAPPTNVVPLRQ